METNYLKKFERSSLAGYNMDLPFAFARALSGQLFAASHANRSRIKVEGEGPGSELLADNLAHSFARSSGHFRTENEDTLSNFSL